MPSLQPIRFNLGRVVLTPGAENHLPEDEIHMALTKHQTCDWTGESLEYREANELALAQGKAIFSACRTNNGIRFFIATEDNRKQTTVFLEGYK